MKQSKFILILAVLLLGICTYGQTQGCLICFPETMYNYDTNRPTKLFYTLASDESDNFILTIMSGDDEQYDSFTQRLDNACQGGKSLEFIFDESGNAEDHWGELEPFIIHKSNCIVQEFNNKIFIKFLIDDRKRIKKLAYDNLMILIKL